MVVDVSSLVVCVEVRYNVVVTIAVTREVFAFRVVVTACVLITVDVTVAVIGRAFVEVSVLNFVKYLVMDSVVYDVVVTFCSARGCAGGQGI